MSDFHAICPGCDTSLHFDRNEDDVYFCPRCNRMLYYNKLQAGGYVIDAERAGREYAQGKYYLAKRDYDAAQRQFDKVRALDKNNFFAEYFYRYCEIKAIHETGRLCGAEIIMALIEEPIAKMAHTEQPGEVKKLFLLHAFGDAFSFAEELYLGIQKIFSSSDQDTERRNEYLNFARGLRRLTTLDRSAAMLGDLDVAKAVGKLCDLTMQALQLANAARIYSTELRVPATAQSEEARALFGVYRHFMKSVCPDHAGVFSSEIYRENLAFNRAVEKKITAHRSDGRSLLKQHLSVRDDRLTHLLYFCRTAFTYSYHTVFKGLGNRKKSDLTDLLTSAVRIGVEILRPRFFAGADGIEIDALDFAALSEFARFFNEMCEELSVADVGGLSEILNGFYSQVLEDVSFHYAAVIDALKAQLETLRANKNAAYFYGRNFLYGVVACSSVALREIVMFDGHRMQDRIKLLRIGHDAGICFSFLFDNKTAEMEKIPKFAHFPAIFNRINTELRAPA